LFVQLFGNRGTGSLEGAIKTKIGTKTDLVFLYMKLLLNSMCPMIHSSIIIVYTYIWYYDYYCTIEWQASRGNWSWYANRPAM
jgi:uncharacterized membrane protein (DUF106 family)